MHKLDFKKESNQLILPPAKIRLFVQDVIDFSSQYGKENSSSYTVSNIRSRPHYFPKYGDFLGKMIKSLATDFIRRKTFLFREKIYC